MTVSARTASRRAARRRVLTRILVPALVVVVAFLVTTAAAVGTLMHNLDRADGAFDDLGQRPADESPDALDVLLVSTDMVTVLHIDGDRHHASMIWLPPQTEPTVASVEHVTGVRIDHYAELDWSVLGELEPTAGPFWPPYEASADPRVSAQRQEDYLRMVIGGNVHQEMASNPVELYQFLATLSDHLTVDREWTAWEFVHLLASMRSVRAWDLQYLTAPTGASSAEFWEAVRHDRTAGLASLAPASGDAGR